MISETTLATIIVAIVAAAPPTIAALAAFVQSKAALLSANHAAQASQATQAKADVLTSKTDGLVGQLAEVHTLANANLSAVKAELAQAMQRIADLVILVNDLKHEKQQAALAVALATTPPVVRPRPARASDGPAIAPRPKGPRP